MGTSCLRDGQSNVLREARTDGIFVGGSWWKYEDYLVETYSQPKHHDADQTVGDDLQHVTVRTTYLQYLQNAATRLLKRFAYRSA